MFRVAHKLDPSAVLFFNDYNVEDGCDIKSTPEKFVEQVVDLQELGAPVGGIPWTSSPYWVSLSGLLRWM
jgi:GH35 family endo-1,4-beta-xylanase